jgi:hypothetical protein
LKAVIVRNHNGLVKGALVLASMTFHFKWIGGGLGATCRNRPTSPKSREPCER